VYTAVAIVKVKEAREEMTSIQPHSSARVGPKQKDIMHAKPYKPKLHSKQKS
jgi:hypothetical protein